MRILSTLAIGVIGAGLIAAPAFAAPKKITVKMSSSEEVPPNDTKASGVADLTYDAATKELTWSVSAKDLSGAPIAAHLHGPADAGANAGVFVNLGAGGMTLPLTGKATLTDEQAAAFAAGKTYVNVHTAEHKGGEIRGQVKP